MHVNEGISFAQEGIAEVRLHYNLAIISFNTTESHLKCQFKYFWYRKKNVGDSLILEITFS